MDTYSESTPKGGEKRLPVFKAALAKHGSSLLDEDRKAPEFAIQREEALNKVARERGL